ncbi:MAG TPA: TIGR03557 family F420-dependent LLM class oxidoreductase [Frankiaceae bacterium]|jgi:G6PDH family F420-dependent oxidoreductase|nr:TIGR03557 family F420-dependent LLM class oxidoreductase [Frankiaceae bacterium]
MVRIGYTLSSEEHEAMDLVRNARRAEEIGVDFVSVSDHFHPWVDAQGHSPFVWAVLGGIAATTSRIDVATGVTAPIMRIHPAVIAQASATVATMLPGRFFFGVGTGEALNEHILGQHWPQADVRLEMLEEAVHIIREMWEGNLYSHRGTHYTVENARLYSIPDTPPPIVVSGGGPKATELAGRIGDGYWGMGPNAELVETFRKNGGEGPTFAQITVCWAEDVASARRTAYEVWPNTGLSGQLAQELALPSYFESAVESLTEEQVTGSLALGPDPEPYVESFRTYVDAGFDHVYFHQIGPDQAGFLSFFERELLPRLRD